MDLEHGSKKLPPAAAPAAPTPSPSSTLLRQLSRDRLVACLHPPAALRASAVLATAAAAAVMGSNTQSYTAVVAVIGTRPLAQTFTAKFADAPAFVYFVVANAIAGAYNLAVAVLLMRRLILWRRAASLVVRMLDMVMVILLATGAAAAASTAYLGKKGNSHARWNPICDRFGSFCSRGGIALASSFIGVALMLALNLLAAAADASSRANE